MRLAGFLQELLDSGQVTVAGQVDAFTADEVQQATEVLRDYHAADLLEMPGTGPAFDPVAAVWAAQLLYRAIQLALLRELGEDIVRGLLADFPEPVTAEAVYSVDLTFRYLPDLLQLAQGLAPDDVLVARLREMAGQWPFSFVGVAALPTDRGLSPVLAHPSLRLAYADRVVRARDRDRAGQPAVAALVQAALGDYGALLWPDFQAVIPKT